MRVYKKPVQVEAVQFTGSNWEEVMLFVGTHRDSGDQWDITSFNPIGTYTPAHVNPDFDAEVWDKLHDTWVLVKRGQWIIKGVQGEFYPCKPDIFAETYTTTPPEELDFDMETMDKVRNILDKVRSDTYTGSDIVAQLQNAGILFRERKAE